MPLHTLEQRTCQLARADDALGMVLSPETRLFTIDITLIILISLRDVVVAYGDSFVMFMCFNSTMGESV